MQSKWISSSSNRENNSVPKVRPGAFSNQISGSKQFHEPQNSRSGRTYHIPDQNRLSKAKNPPHSSYEIMNRNSNYMDSENQVFASMLENNVPSMSSEQFYQHHNVSAQPLADKSNNQSQVRESRSQPHSNPAKNNPNDKSSRTQDENVNKPSQQGSYVKILQHSQSVNKNRESNSKSPLSYAKRRMTPGQAPGTSSRKASRPQANDENVNEISHPKVTRSHSTLVLSGAAENKGQGSANMHHRSSEAFYVQEQEGENVQKLKMENQELWKNVEKLTTEVQNEKKKCAVLEAETENFKNDLVKERDRYKEELCKISLQIKKLRNIQNIYVTEKKNSEKLENQLNVKEKALNDTSNLLCESLKSMVSVLELVLLKGDVALDKHWKARDFHPDMMFKLFNDIRRQLLPKIEEADQYNLEFEWKGQDFKDIVTHTKEFLRLKKTNSSKGFNAQKENTFNPNEAKAAPFLQPNYNINSNSGNTNNTIFSPVFAQSDSLIPTFNPALDMPKKASEPELFQQKPPSDISNRDKIASKSLNDLQSQLQKINDYVPIHARMSLAEIKMQEDIHHGEDLAPQNKSLEVIQEDRCVKKRAASVSKCWEGESQIQENFMAGSLASSIAPRTNNCSGFAETFENFLGADGNSKLNSADRRGSVISNKNYDLPLATSSMSQTARSNNEQEATKNQAPKPKQNIEVRRASSTHFDVEPQGIAEISDESTTSFQRTLEDDNLPRPSYKEAPQRKQDPADNYQQGFALKMNKAPSQPAMNRESDFKEIKKEPSSSRKDEMPFKLTRSNSSITVIPDDGQKTQVQQMKKDNSQRNLTQESQRDAPPPSKDDNSDRRVPSARSILEQFAVAKFDYNAQKDNDLSFSQGDKIKILRKTETGWWIGLCNNKIGYFPSNFVDVAE